MNFASVWPFMTSPPSAKNWTDKTNNESVFKNSLKHSLKSLLGCQDNVETLLLHTAIVTWLAVPRFRERGSTYTRERRGADRLLLSRRRPTVLCLPEEEEGPSSSNGRRSLPRHCPFRRRCLLPPLRWRSAMSPTRENSTPGLTPIMQTQTEQRIWAPQSRLYKSATQRFRIDVWMA